MDVNEALEKRILIIDGAMGTMIQKHKLNEEDYRGERFKNYSHSLKGNNDLLVLTQAHIIEQIHVDFLEAGADIIETNTFNANSISMLDYHMSDLVVELNTQAVEVAKKARNRFQQLDDRPIFIAGAIGPTNKTTSLSPDVNNPGFREVSFDDLVECYGQQARALIDAGADLLLVETVFDTLNCKAALFAINTIKDELKIDIPVMVSGTITDASGRTLSGQTTEAFYNSISHGDLLSVGLNCALGVEQMRQYVEELSRVSLVNVSCYPNAGLPNEFGEYDDTPEHMSEVMADWAEQGWVNIVGGCCGTTPEHIRAIADKMKQISPRVIPVEV
jgi:5-methyltetrahydrofolate--homocysteine methyltransferase